MREMKDSGVEWIGEIPEDWTVCRISQTGHYINGFAFKPEDWGEDGLPIIRIQDLSGSNDSPNYFNGQIDKKYLVHHGDLLVSWAATLDAYRWQGDDAWLNQHIFKVINADGIDEKFLRWLLATTIRHLDSGNKHGIMMQHLTWGMFAHCPVPLPPPQYQSLLGETLDIYCGRIDEVTVLLGKEISTLERYRASVIHEAVTRGLDPTVPTKPSGVDWIGEIPEGCKLARLKDILKINNGKEIVNDDGPIPVYGSGGRFKWTDKALCTEPALLLGRKGTINNPLLVEEPFWTVDTMFYGTKTLNSDLRFIYYCALCFDYGYYQTGSTLPSMTQSDLGGVLLPFPGIDEQRAIADYLDARTAAIDAVLETKRRQLDILKRRRQSLIYEYVTGKRRVAKEV